MTENKEKIKSITYIKNGTYLFNIIKVNPYSVAEVEKIGLTIYKKNLEINTLNKDNIDILLNNTSDYVISYGNIGFINIHGILCFLYASKNDIKEKQKSNTGQNNNPPYKIYRIENIHCFIISLHIPTKLKKIVKDEFDKIGSFLIGEELYFCEPPFRFDFNLPNQLKAFNDNFFKYQLNENYMYNENFSPLHCRRFLTPIVKAFYKNIFYNYSFNEKQNVNAALRYKIYDINKYLIEVEMFITPTNYQKMFQNIFYVYYNESDDKIDLLKKILENWYNNIDDKNKINSMLKNYNNIKKEGLIINLYSNDKNDKNNEIKNREFEEELKKLNDFDIINLKNLKEEMIENALNENIDKLKSIGHNYKYNNVDYNSQNKLLILTGNNDENLFSMIKIVAYTLYRLFLTERGIQKNVINNTKEEIIKYFKIFEKKIEKLKKKFPQRPYIKIIQDEKELNNLLKFDEKEDSKNQLNFNINNKEYVMVESENKNNNDFVIVDSLENYDKLNKDKNNLEEEEDNQDNIDEENQNNIYENNNIDDNNDLSENVNSPNDEEYFKDNNYNDINDNININQIESQVMKLENVKVQNQKNNIITIFIGTFNVNALESNLIKSTNLDKFLFPENLKDYFTQDNYPTFYCIGLEETVELNPKNVLIKPKNKAEQWEERITMELLSKYNYFLQCKEQLVGVLLLFFVKASEIKYIKNIHIEKLKSGFMGCGNKGCCFLDFEYKKNTYGFCSCHLPAGQNKKNYLDRKETFTHLLNFKVNKNINEFYKNDYFFIFGDLNFRTKKIGLIDLHNHIKIIEGDSKINNNDKKKKKFRFSLDLNNKKDKKKRQKKMERNISESSIEVKLPKDIVNEKNNIYQHQYSKSREKEKKNKKEKKDDYSDYYTNNNKTEIKQINMDENILTQFFFNEFLENEELKKLKEEELYKYNIDEANITFPPTYKYIKGTNFYNLSKRVPSWTDRILYKKEKKIIPIYYNRICINFSDHKPIVGLYEINYGEEDDK